MKLPKHMKISELSKASSTPATSIRFYIKEGLLPEPIKTSKTMAYYTRDHLDRLRFIEKIKKEENLPLSKIRELIQKEFPITNFEENKRVYTNRREEIVEVAIELFREKGYSETSITDIVNRAGIGRGTFYANFENKEELFIECADKIFYDMYDNVWQDIKGEKDMRQRLAKRTRAFIESYPKWIDMMNLVRGSSISRNPAFTEKLHQVMKQIIEPLSRDVERGIQQGAYRKVDPVIFGHILMGSAEYCTYLYYQNKKKYDAEEIFKVVEDVLMNGVYKK